MEKNKLNVQKFFNTQKPIIKDIIPENKLSKEAKNELNKFLKNAKQ